MDTNVNLEIEKFKIQKTQMYLQIVSVMLSATLIYFLVKDKNKNAANVDDSVADITD
jgi:hypothetical protein